MTEKVHYAVEASHFEKQALWEKLNHRAIKWENMPGTIEVCGQVGGHDVCVELSYVEISGVRVLFFNGCSRVVDYVMVDNWVRENALVPGGMTVSAEDFHLIFNAIHR